MKYIVLVGDGMSDRALARLNDRTPLEVAATPFMDGIVKEGRIGHATTIPKGMTPASDVANLAIMGYDPKKYYNGRGPLEAANINVKLGEGDVAFRCNLVTVGKDEMVDYSAGHITQKEAEILISDIDKKLGSDTGRFYVGKSYRHLFVLKAATHDEAVEISKVKCAPPHDILSKKIKPFLPKGKSSQELINLMEASKEVLEKHDINKVRVDLGENPANMIWLWGQGVNPNMPPFKELFGLTGSVISAVDLVNGLGKLVGLETIKVPGATGYYDTNYQGKADYALESLKHKDFVFVHVEAPDEAGHNADMRAKITAIENFDKHVVGTFLKAFKGKKGYRLMVLPDHATPLSVRTHVSDPIPFAVCGDGVEPDQALVFSERAAMASAFGFSSGHALMHYLVHGDSSS
jgi:2,3-bisphosphoglycerate-independent phosphoglycerate mutase